MIQYIYLLDPTWDRTLQTLPFGELPLNTLPNGCRPILGTAVLASISASLAEILMPFALEILFDILLLYELCVDYAFVYHAFH